MKKTLFTAFAILFITIGTAHARVFLAFADTRAEAFQKAQTYCLSRSYHKERCRFLLEYDHPPSSNGVRWEVRFTDDK